MASQPVLIPDYGDVSTAPTTPEGSFSFSPVLQARNAETMSYDKGGLAAKAEGSFMSLSGLASSLATPVVRNICCVGAGYVGRWLALTLRGRRASGLRCLELILGNRRPNIVHYGVPESPHSGYRCGQR
jgi:hypothetical protein